MLPDDGGTDAASAQPFQAAAGPFAPPDRETARPEKRAQPAPLAPPVLDPVFADALASGIAGRLAGVWRPLPA